MGSVKGKYIKDENGTVFSPISSINATFDNNGITTPQNLEYTSSILDKINGTSAVGAIQDSKSATVTENGTITITPDSGYIGMKQCAITASNLANLHEKTYSITSPATVNHTVSPDSGYNGMSKATINVNVKPSVARSVYSSQIMDKNTNKTVFTYSPNNTATHFWLYLYYNIGNTSAAASSTITFTFQGSQDNSSWTSIKSFTKTRGTTTTITFTYNFNNISGYKYYRILCKSTDEEKTVGLQTYRIMM